VVIAGYAADRRSPQGSGLNERDIQIWLNDIADPSNLLGYASPADALPSGAPPVPPELHPVAFARAWNPCALSAGSYEIIVWVSSLVRPGARNRASVDVTVGACPTAAAATAGPGPVPTIPAAPPAVSAPAADASVDIRCSARGTGHACVLNGQGPAGTVGGSNVEVTMETLADGAVRVETFPCGPVGASGQVQCRFTTAGSIFQGHIVTVTFRLDGGRQHPITFVGGCAASIPSGRPCP
jgi:hypothetical protein